MNTPDQTMILILGEIKGTVAEVKEAIRELKETVANNNRMNTVNLEKVDERLTSLEHLRERAVAYITVISAGVGAAFHFIPKAIAGILGGH